MVATDALLKHVHTHTDIVDDDILAQLDNLDLIYLNPSMAEGGPLDGLFTCSKVFVFCF